MTAKYKEAARLRSLGLSLVDIALELYPEEARTLARLRGLERRRFREKLKKRVFFLLKYASKRLDPDHSGVLDPPPPSTPERVEMMPRWSTPIRPTRNPANRKRWALNREERQLVEYEQYLRRVYRRELEHVDRDGVIWEAARAIHEKVFPVYYKEYRVNYWGKRARSPVKAYAYVVLSIAALYNGVNVRWRLYESLQPGREDVQRISSLVLPLIL